MVLALYGVGIWSLVIGDVVRSVLKVTICFAVVGRTTVPRWHREVGAKLWRYGRAALAGSFLEFALQNVDYALVALLLGPVALGLYTIAFRVAILPFLIVTYVLAGVAFPLYARLMPDRQAVQRVMELTMRACCGAVFLMGVGLATLAPSLELLGRRWAPSVPVARLLGIYICLRSAAFLTSMLLRVASPAVNAILKGAWVALLAALIATVGRSGIVAVGAIQVAVAGPMLVAYLVLASRLTGVSVRPVLVDVARIGFAAVLAAGATLGLRQLSGALADPTSFGALVCLGVVFCGVYALAMALVLPRLASDLRQLRVSEAPRPARCHRSCHEAAVELGRASVVAGATAPPAGIDAGRVPPDRRARRRAHRAPSHLRHPHAMARRAALAPAHRRRRDSGGARRRLAQPGGRGDHRRRLGRRPRERLGGDARGGHPGDVVCPQPVDRHARVHDAQPASRVRGGRDHHRGAFAQPRRPAPLRRRRPRARVRGGREDLEDLLGAPVSASRTRSVITTSGSVKPWSRPATPRPSPPGGAGPARAATRCWSPRLHRERPAGHLHRGHAGRSQRAPAHRRRPPAAARGVTRTSG